MADPFSRQLPLGSNLPINVNADGTRALETKTAMDTLQRNTEQGWRQLYAGAAGNYVHSPAAAQDLGSIGHAIPNAAWKMGALPGAGRMLYEMATGQEPTTDDWLAAPLKYARSGEEYANEEYAGTGDPQNTSDWFNRMGGELMSLPLPTGGATQILSKAPKVKAIADAAIGVTFPGMQATTKGGKVAEVAGTTALMDTVEEYINPVYDSSIYEAQFSASEKFLAQEINETQYPEIGDEQDMELMDLSLQLGLDEPILSEKELLQTEMLSATDSMQGVTEDDTRRLNGVAIEDDNGWTTGAKFGAGLATGALLLGGKGYAAGRIAKHNRQKAESASLLRGSSDKSIPTKEKIDTQERMSPNLKATDEGYLSSGQVAQAQTYDTYSPLHDMIDDALKRGDIDEAMSAQMKTDITARFEVRPLSTRIREFAKSGVFPSSRRTNETIETVPLGHLLERASTLKPETRAMLDDLLIAETRADDIRGGGSWGQHQVADLDGMATAIRSQDPEVAKLADDFQQYNRDMAKYLHDKGIIPTHQYNKWRNGAKHYMPLRLADGDAFDTDMLIARRSTNDLLAIQPGEAASPIDQMAEYTTRMVKLAENNEARDAFLRTASDTFTMKTRGNKGVIERFRGTDDKAAARKDTVSAMHNGKRVFYKVNDPHLRQILLSHPQFGDNYTSQVGKILGGIPNITKQFITGKFAPEFAPVGAGYDAVMGFLEKTPDLNTGILSKYTDNALLNRIDPSSLVNPFTGAMQNAYSEMMSYGARKLHANLYSDGRLTQLIGDENVARLSEVMQNAYRNSTKRLYERHGGGTSPIWGATDADAPDIVSQISPKYSKNVSEGTRAQVKATARVYESTMDAIHGSQRTAAFGHNIDRGKVVRSQIMTKMPDGRTIPVATWQREFQLPMNNQDMSTIAAKVRDLGGDLGKKGGIPGTEMGKWYRRYLDATLYSNVAIQSMVRLGKAVHRNPETVAGGMVALGMAGQAQIYNQIMNNPQAREHYLGLSPSQRARNLYFYNDEGEPILAMGIPNELRMFWSPFIESLLVSSGHIDQLDQSASQMMRQGMNIMFKDALWNIIPQAAKLGAATLTGATVAGEGAGFLPANSDLTQWLKHPDYYDAGLNDDQVDSEILGSMRAIADTLASVSGQNLMDASLAAYYNMGGGKDASEGMSKAFSHVGAKFRTKGKSSSLLFKNQDKIDAATSVDRPENSYVYDTVSKMKTWLARYDASQTHPTLHSKRPPPGSRIKGESTFAELENPEQDAYLSMHLKQLKDLFAKQGFTHELSELQKEKKEIRYGGSAYGSKSSKINALNVRKQDQNITLTKMLKEIRRVEQAISEETGQPFTFSELPKRPALKGRSDIVPVSDRVFMR